MQLFLLVLGHLGFYLCPPYSLEKSHSVSSNHLESNLRFICSQVLQKIKQNENNLSGISMESTCGWTSVF